MPPAPALAVADPGAAERPHARGSLSRVSALAEAATEAERTLFVEAAEYAAAHPPVSWTGRPVPAPEDEPASTWIDSSAIAEFACATSRTQHSATTYLAQALECAARLPRLWARVVAGEIAVWRARAIVERTVCLSDEAAASVDAHLADYAHSCSFTQIGRTVEAAIAAHDPGLAARRAREAADQRTVQIHLRHADPGGTVEMTGTLDHADALDLDHALSDVAADLRAAGCEESLDVRRSMALGELGRKQLALEFPTVDTETGEITPPPTGRGRRRRELTLYVHLSEQAVATGVGVGRCENTRTAITVEQIRRWCATTGTTVLLRPVLDTGAERHVDAYEATHLQREVVVLRDTTCVAPSCTRPGRRLDLDHIEPYDHHDPGRGGATSTHNLAPLCRAHHLLKTHRGWSYEVLDDPGGRRYLWTTPAGRRYLRGPTGTIPLD